MTADKSYGAEIAETPPLLPTSTQRPPRKTAPVGRVIAAVLLCVMLLTPLGLLSSSGSNNTTPVPPLDPAFVSHCCDLLSTPHDYPARLGALAALLADSDSVWVAEPGASAEYFIGAFGDGSWSPSERPFLVAVGGEDDVVIVTPEFEAPRAKLHPLPESVHVTWLAWAESESPYTTLAKHFPDRPVVLDPQVRTFIGDGIRKKTQVKTIPVTLREHKDTLEIGLMRCANQFTLQAIKATRARMAIGIRESETRAILYEEMERLGLTGNGALILFGENAATPHGTGTDRRLGIHDFALIDAGGRWGGYIADITRTFSLPESEISDEHRQVWRIVQDAQRAPAELIAKSEREDHVRFSWLDDVAREAVKRGMAAYGVRPAPGPKPDYTVFTHRLGHGIGLEGHEAPYVVQGPLGEHKVAPGSSVTFEPGVYIPAGSTVADKSVVGLGVRLEDVVVFREEHGGIVVDWLTGPASEHGGV